MTTTSAPGEKLGASKMVLLLWGTSRRFWAGPWTWQRQEVIETHQSTSWAVRTLWSCHIQGLAQNRREVPHRSNTILDAPSFSPYRVMGRSGPVGRVEAVLE